MRNFGLDLSLICVRLRATPFRRNAIMIPQKHRLCSLSATLRGLMLAAVMSVPCVSAAAHAECPDLDGDTDVDIDDLTVVITSHGLCFPGDACTADIDGDGEVTSSDIGLLIMEFGDCPTWYTVLEQNPDPNVVWDATLAAAITATGKPWRVLDNLSGIEMVLIPPGNFHMGGGNPWLDSSGVIYGPPLPLNECCEHLVYLTNAFYVGRTEVTQADWIAIMGTNPSHFTGDTSRPVEGVSWNDIQPFCTATGLRLLTEAEWEYAFRAGTQTALHGMPGYLSGTSLVTQAATIAWTSVIPLKQVSTQPVAGKAANSFGLFDMAGNVAEWVNDWYCFDNNCTAAGAINPTGPSSSPDGRAYRNGGYSDLDCRSTMRGGYSPDIRYQNLGFRVAKTP
jgi:formylglycine-generating enzyme required for sulfatase activity